MGLRFGFLESSLTTHATTLVIPFSILVFFHGFQNVITERNTHMFRFAAKVIRVRFHIPQDSFVSLREPLVVGAAHYLMNPNNFIDKVLGAKDFVEKTTKVRRPAIVAVHKKRAILGECFLHEEQALEHKLEVIVVGPNIGVLDLFT